MSKQGIDASIGLTLSLELLERYQQSGVLRADLPKAFGIPRHCQAFLHLLKGEVVSVYLADQQGQRYASAKEKLCRLDREKGPFEWILLSQMLSPDQPNVRERVFPPQFLSSAQFPLIPKYIGALEPDRIRTWTSQQRNALFMVLRTINDIRTVAEIKRALPLSPDLVDELLCILCELEVIVLAV